MYNIYILLTYGHVKKRQENLKKKYSTGQMSKWSAQSVDGEVVLYTIMVMECLALYLRMCILFTPDHVTPTGEINKNFDNEEGL